jgi:sulfur carrier protein
MAQFAPVGSIRVNGQDEPCCAHNVAALLAAKDILPDQRGLAVARNGELVPRARWPDTPVEPGDSIEIVIAKQGG